jgi:hypothetical protein
LLCENPIGLKTSAHTTTLDMRLESAMAEVRGI